MAVFFLCFEDNLESRLFLVKVETINVGKSRESCFDQILTNLDSIDKWNFFNFSLDRLVIFSSVNDLLTFFICLHFLFEQTKPPPNRIALTLHISSNNYQMIQ